MSNFELLLRFLPLNLYSSSLPFALQGSIKLYKVPLRVVYEPRNIRCFATKSTAALPGTQKEDDIFRTVSAPKNLSRSSNSMNEFERELQEFFLQVKTMLKKGNIDGARNLLQANYEAVKEQIAGGANGMEQATILDVIALGYMGVGDFEFVECLLDMVTKMLVVNGGNIVNTTAENMEIGSPGIYNDNPSLVFHNGYGYNPQMPFGPYSHSPVTTPLSSMRGGGHLYSGQQIPFSGPSYYQQLVHPNMPYFNSNPVSESDWTTPVGIDQQGDGRLFGPRPGYSPQFGSTARGSSFHRNSDGQRSLTPFSPAVSPQPVNFPGPFGRNAGMVPLDCDGHRIV